MVSHVAKCQESIETQSTHTLTSTSECSMEILFSSNARFSWCPHALRMGTRIYATGVCEKTLLLCEPFPCSPAAETALQPPSWCSESLSTRGHSYPEDCFFHRHRHPAVPPATLQRSRSLPAICKLVPSALWEGIVTASLPVVVLPASVTLHNFADFYLDVGTEQRTLISTLK